MVGRHLAGHWKTASKCHRTPRLMWSCHTTDAQPHHNRSTRNVPGHNKAGLDSARPAVLSWIPAHVSDGLATNVGTLLHASLCRCSTLPVRRHLVPIAERLNVSCPTASFCRVLPLSGALPLRQSMTPCRPTGIVLATCPPYRQPTKKCELQGTLLPTPPPAPHLGASRRV